MPDYMMDDAGGCVDRLLRLIGHEQVAEWQYVLVRYKWRDLQRGLLQRALRSINHPPTTHLMKDQEAGAVQ